MINVTCWNCGYERKRGDPLTHPCPRCRKDWRKPSILTRLKMALREGYEAFKASGVPKGYHERVFKPKQATIDDFISEEQAAAQGYETDPGD